MTITQTNTGSVLPVTALPTGPVTEMRWYRTRKGTGLLVVFRRSIDGAPEKITFTTQMGGRLRRLRVRDWSKQP